MLLLGVALRQAVFVAISIPIFTSQLEKSREAVDAANIRAAYAEIMADVLTGDLASPMTAYDVDLVQTTGGFATTFDWPENLTVTGTGTAKASFTYAADTNIVTCTLS